MNDIEIFKAGEAVLIDPGLDPRNLGGSSPSFVPAMTKYIGSVGIIKSVGRSLEIEFSDGCTYYFKKEWVNQLPIKREAFKPYNKGDILVAESKEVNFKGIFILEKSISQRCRAYSAMVSTINGISHIFEDNKIEHHSIEVREAEKDEIDMFKNILMESNDLWIKYRKHFE